MAKKVALVAGVSGVVGRGIVEQLGRLGDWETIGLSRSPDDQDGLSHRVAVDLLDPDDCREKLGGLAGVTHVFFSAYQARPTESAAVTANASMLRNLVDAVEAATSALAHINLMEGVKAYGCHFGPYMTPAKETDPRHMPPNFYYDQEDFLRSRQPDKSWTWSALRPSLVCGPGVGHPMNLLMVIAVYASICRELGLPLRFPGTNEAYRVLFEATDASLLGRAAIWAASEPRCGNQIFNITNGDYFRWEHLWPRIAAWFGLETAPPLPIPLARTMADKGPLWDEMVRRDGLRAHAYEELVSWEFGEFVFRLDYDVISNTTKARQFGFHDVSDTEEMFARRFQELRDQRYIP